MAPNTQRLRRRTPWLPRAGSPRAQCRRLATPHADATVPTARDPDAVGWACELHVRANHAYRVRRAGRSHGVWLAGASARDAHHRLVTRRAAAAGRTPAIDRGPTRTGDPASAGPQARCGRDRRGDRGGAAGDRLFDVAKRGARAGAQRGRTRRRPGTTDLTDHAKPTSGCARSEHAGSVGDAAVEVVEPLNWCPRWECPRRCTASASCFDQHVGAVSPRQPSMSRGMRVALRDCADMTDTLIDCVVVMASSVRGGVTRMAGATSHHVTCGPRAPWRRSAGVNCRRGQRCDTAARNGQ